MFSQVCKWLSFVKICWKDKTDFKVSCATLKITVFWTIFLQQWKSLGNQTWLILMFRKWLKKHECSFEAFLFLERHLEIISNSPFVAPGCRWGLLFFCCWSNNWPDYYLLGEKNLIPGWHYWCEPLTEVQTPPSLALSFCIIQQYIFSHFKAPTTLW